VRNLDRRRYRVSLIAGQGGELATEARNIKHLRVELLSCLKHPISPYHDLLAFFRLRRLFKELRPDIVHTHSSKAGIIGRFAASAAGVPVLIHTVHGWGMHRFQPRWLRGLYVLLERWVARFTDKLIAVAHENVKYGLSLGIGKHSDYLVIRSGIARSEYTAKKTLTVRQLGFEPGTRLVGMVGPLKAQKAPLEYVELAAEVLARQSNCGFLLIGEGRLRKQAEKLVRRLGIAKHFKILGWRDDVADIMPCLKVFVLTSRWEGLPRSLLQALASGLPAVVTAVNGIPEVVTNGANGYLHQPGDVPGMANSLCRLLKDDRLRKRLSYAARKSVTREFEIDTMLGQIDQLYQSLWAKQQKSRSLTGQGEGNE
jgi:glycosyltransferase involved in cell wall biosynthesis